MIKATFEPLTYLNVWVCSQLVTSTQRATLRTSTLAGLCPCRGKLRPNGASRCQIPIWTTTRWNRQSCRAWCIPAGWPWI